MNPSTVSQGPGTAVALGFFDGVHLGHQALLHRAQELAARHHLTSVALTFDLHPREVLGKTGPLVYLTPLEEKVDLLRAYGMERVEVIPFTSQFATLSGREFVVHYLVEGLGARFVVVGQDFAFGRGRSCRASDLKSLGRPYGLQAEVLDEVRVSGQRVSSTAVRQALLTGEVTTAWQMLGRPYTLHGQVVSGRGGGRKLGFPTANLTVSERKLLPARGVYAVQVEWGDQRCWGALNYGCRPTLDGGQWILEVHVLDFEGNLYGQSLTLSLLRRLRRERRFPNVDALRQAIGHDVERVRELTLQFAENVLQ
ncbi:MAG TPA: bifunctional riboflavin kinase/FAD synthetase [Armatimonadetes bacterium]|nr:bifunctional riboflavin kinase/FAD synthetase [Armatimonadota bacterium]